MCGTSPVTQPTQSICVPCPVEWKKLYKNNMIPLFIKRKLKYLIRIIESDCHDVPICLCYTLKIIQQLFAYSKNISNFSNVIEQSKLIAFIEMLYHAQYVHDILYLIPVLDGNPNYKIYLDLLNILNVRTEIYNMFTIKVSLNDISNPNIVYKKHKCNNDV